MSVSWRRDASSSGKSREGEIFISLDEKERSLKEGTLLICDGVKPVAIAGIMGGLNSEVKGRHVHGPPRKRLFQSGLDPAILPVSRDGHGCGVSASNGESTRRGLCGRSTGRPGLMAELADGVSCLGYIDAHPQEVQIAKDIPLRVTRVNDILGLS
ncbi:MAG: phenylalanine--tRNA ligase beta subunit-related protein [Syntrophales bacterium]